MEPLGVLVFSVFMISSFLQVFIESIQRILDKNLEEQPLGAIALGVMGATIVIKGEPTSAVFVFLLSLIEAVID